MDRLVSIKPDEAHFWESLGFAQIDFARNLPLLTCSFGQHTKTAVIDATKNAVASFLKAAHLFRVVGNTTRQDEMSGVARRLVEDIKSLAASR
mmetsp:Transcript_6304/g.16646  ORF Transcript_6304/g.16646 Transcript_6304/m.16646 type:complete len:93 (+) Transcript_6304:1-279(+)